MTDNLWTQAALGDVVENWIVGSTPSRTKPGFFASQGGTPWAKAEDVNGGTLHRTAEQLSEAGGRQLRLVPKDAVLVTTAGTIGKTAIAGGEMYCNQAVQALSFRKDLVLPQYGCYFLRSQRPLLNQLANSTTIHHISKKKLQSVQIRFPPLPVQAEIAARLRLSEMLAEKAEQLQSVLNRYLLAEVTRAARQAKTYLPVGELLEEDPLTGLRAKASPTGNGIPLVNKLGGNGGRLTRLEDCLRVQVPENQLARYRLRPMDILLRSSALGSGTRGALVGELPEEALVGGNLTRLRLKSSFSPVWLLAWLRGPGGDRLYVDGRLQRQMLRQYRVPVPEGQPELERRLLLHLALEEKAAPFAGGTRALFESALHRTFSKSTVGAASADRAAARLEANLARLTPPMNRFLQEMSRFQRELYQALLRSEDGWPVHTLLKQLQKGPRRERAAGIQDALSTVALLEQFGLIEQEDFRKIPLPAAGAKQPDGQPAYITDHNGRPVLIDTYQPTRDIFEENAYAAGAGQDTEL